MLGQMNLCKEEKGLSVCLCTSVALLCKVVFHLGQISSKIGFFLTNLVLYGVTEKGFIQISLWSTICVVMTLNNLSHSVFQCSSR